MGIQKKGKRSLLCRTERIQNQLVGENLTQQSVTVDRKLEFEFQISDLVFFFLKL